MRHHRASTIAAGFLLGFLAQALAFPTPARGACSLIYPSTSGWAIELCTTDPSVPATMQVSLDGVAKGLAARIAVYHDTEDGLTQPQVAVVYASGFIRLKQNADPTPFGTSAVLGPAYWPLGAGAEEYNPTLTTLSIETDELPTGPLRLAAAGTNAAFDVAYEMALPPPRDRQTRLHVVQAWTANAAVTVDPGRTASAEGFKLVQFSSMFIPEGTCDGALTECHDSDGARYLGADGASHDSSFAALTLPGFVFAGPGPLGGTWLDVTHGDDSSWQGNTPNLRVALDVAALPPGTTMTPQGWIDATTDPNDDNVGLWLHDDDPAVTSWSTGEAGEVSYWLLAQDDPPDPWADLGLRPGMTFLDLEGSESCVFVRDAGQATSGAIATIDGYAGSAKELAYDLGAVDGNWAQIRCDLASPLDLSAYDHLRFEWRGDPAAANSLEVALISEVAPGEDRIFGRGFHHATHRGWWDRMVVPFRFLNPWTAGTVLDASKIKAFFVSVVKDPVADTGGPGTLAIDNVGAFDVENRTVPAAFETVPANPEAADRAAAWLASRQQPTGLLESWLEETSCIAHTYDQALALLVFMDAGMLAEADVVVTGLAATQNPNGSWFKARNCLTLAPVDATEWEGDIAWAVFALNRYLDLGGSLTATATAARDAAAAWLTTRLDSDSGCPVIDHTEGSIDIFWALATAGPEHSCRAAGVRDCLLGDYWDAEMGRVKGGRDWWQPYLDNQTWGGAMLRAIGREVDALRALSYAAWVLTLPAQGGQLHGVDGQGGPWSVWNEGVGQYAAVGGAGAGDLTEELLAQQRLDGAMPGAADDFAGGGVWTSRWHGVAPTSWLYFALTGGPFPASVPLGPEPYRLDVTGSIADTQSLVACDSIFAGPGLHVEAGGDLTLTAGRRIVVSSESSVEAGGRLELRSAGGS